MGDGMRSVFAEVEVMQQTGYNGKVLLEESCSTKRLVAGAG